MAPLSPQAAIHRGRIAGLARAVRNGERPADCPELTDARQNYCAARIVDYAQIMMAKAPALTPEQRRFIADAILIGGPQC